jgi:hypothetical protein
VIARRFLTRLATVADQRIVKAAAVESFGRHFPTTPTLPAARSVGISNETTHPEAISARSHDPLKISVSTIKGHNQAAQ